MSFDTELELSVITPSSSALDHLAANIHHRPTLEWLTSDDRVAVINTEVLEEDTPVIARPRPELLRGFSDQTQVSADIEGLIRKQSGQGDRQITPTNSGTTAPNIAESIGPVIPAVEVLEEGINIRRLRIFACCFALYVNGWNGGSTGALLPHIEKAFNLSYAKVSLLFVSTFLGFVLAALTTGYFSRRVGFGRAMTLAVVVELFGCAINSSQQKYFGLMCFGFWVVGFSFSIQFGMFNTYFASLPNPLAWTGVLHAFFGFGAFASPLVANAMVSRGIPYHLFYATVLGMNVPALALIWLAFRNLHTLPSQPGELTTISSTTLGDTLRSRTVWNIAIFLMLYIGAEESIGGWIVSYVIEVRNGSPENASWVASSFYLGLAIGRLALPTINILMGERQAVFVYLLVAVILETIAWAVPIYASTAVATALFGLAISTIYTAAITMGGKLIPRAMHADAFALMVSVGQSGSAFFPFIVGLISGKKGIWVVEPVVVTLLGAQGLCWFLIPKVARRID